MCRRRAICLPVELGCFSRLWNPFSDLYQFDAEYGAMGYRYDEVFSEIPFDEEGCFTALRVDDDCSAVETSHTGVYLR